MRLTVLCDMEPTDKMEIVFFPSRIAMGGNPIVITDPKKAERIQGLIRLWIDGEVWRLEDETI